MYIEDHSNTIIKNRYLLQRVLGRGGLGTTYQAKDKTTRQHVAIKVVELRQIKDWKVLDLLHRETQVLQHLDHPAIPKYLDSFEIETENNKIFYLVQELAPGKSLSQWIEKGWKPSVDEAIRITSKVLEILIYLQSFTPEIIHRDIKPQNILRSATGNIYLVDLGSVQDVYRHTLTGGSTVVGTFGYMAPEQFRGMAKPATDLYGLGATLIFLLTQRDPAELGEKNFAINFRSELKLGRRLSQWLDGMISPTLEQRFPNAQAALSKLKGEQVASKPRRSKDTWLQIQKGDNVLVIETAPMFSRQRWLARLVYLFTFLTVLWVVLLRQDNLGHSFNQTLSMLMYALVYGSIATVVCFIGTQTGIRLRMTRKSYCLSWGCFFKETGKNGLYALYIDFRKGVLTQFVKVFQRHSVKPVATNRTAKKQTVRYFRQLNTEEIMTTFGHYLPLSTHQQVMESILSFLETSTGLSKKRR